jgi:type VI secretion system secreted protein VgrG
LSGLNDFQVDQTKRLISAESFHLGKNKILITAVDGTEALSSLFRFRLELVTEGRALTPNEILGKSLTFALRAPDQQVRKINGIVSQFQTLKTEWRDHFLQVAELVPPAWLLSLNQRCRIFEKMKATDAINRVLNDWAITVRSTPSTTVREYIVQYCESDFDFISRLMEEEGIFYYFANSETNCPIVMGNSAANYIKLSVDAAKFLQDIDRLQPNYRIGASSFKHAAWDFKAVSVVVGDAKGLPKVQTSGLAERPFYEYSGRHADAGEARDWAKARIEEKEADFVRIQGGSRLIDMQPAAKFTIKGHSIALPASGQTDSYVVTSVDHSARDATGLPTSTPSKGTTQYANTFVCIPAELNFRPPRSTPRPYIRGPQTATVVDGPDEYGRAKVKFPWLEDSQSRWTRIAQNWAYNQMGTQFLPRIDSEVVVEFLDGDPDHPIIVGMVYNGKNKLPYETPANKTQSGIRGANWGAAGTENKSNELRFEDKSGSEEVFFHAQKDFRRVVKNDDSLTVEQGDRTLKIQTGNVNETLDLGNHDLKISAGSQTTEAMQSITLKVGQNSIEINQSGITIKGIMVKVEGTAMVDAKAPMTTVKGDGMLTLKGGITMIN